MGTMLQSAPISIIYIDTSRPKVQLNILHKSSVMFRPTSSLHLYIDQVHNIDDLVIRFSILTVAISFM